MKTKSIILLSLCAIVTLSFTFGAGKKATPAKATRQPIHSNDAHYKGGFALEDKLI